MDITIIGLGYVGSVTAVGLAQDNKVVGIDIDKKKIDNLRGGEVSIYEPGLEKLLKSALSKGNLTLYTPDEVKDLGEVIFICVGTPSLPNGRADISQVKSALEWVVKNKKDSGIIVMKSTVPPGTGKHLINWHLSATSISYISNPEFLREGQGVKDWFHPDRIVIGGEDSKSIQKVKNLYKNINAPIVTADIISAEMVKYAANAFLATKISYINEIANLCDKVRANIDEVAQGIALDPRIGSGFLRAGLGYGGSCFPKDIRAIDYLATANEHSFELIRAAIVVNNRQRLLPLHTLHKRFASLQGISIAILGLAFKPNTDDIREAPALDLIQLLVQEGAKVRACDPKALKNAKSFVPQEVELTKNPLTALSEAQAAILVTEWKDFKNLDWEKTAKIMKSPKIIFDGRNALDSKLMLNLGFEYYGVGRGNLIV